MSGPFYFSEPAEDATASVPLGNGDLTLNAWVDRSGDLWAYVGKSDSWGEFGQLYKLGLFRLRLSDRGGRARLVGDRFRWSLNISSGEMLIETANCWLRLFVDANAPCIRLSAKVPEGSVASFTLKPWRLVQRNLEGQERHGLHMFAPYPVWHGEDVLPELAGQQIACFHHNRSSSWRSNLEQQGLEELASPEKDPLLGRTFGLLVRGAGAMRKSADTLEIQQSVHVEFSAVVLTQNSSSPEHWIREAANLADRLRPEDNAQAWPTHQRWWEKFWNRSHLRIDGNEAGRKVAMGYQTQRYLNACAGRGAFPIKFNGSLFTVDWKFPGENFDADYRRWGPGYWHQNTRLPYWAMLYSGDFDLMQPFFRMYRDALPIARERCRKFCGHAGAFFPETMTFWGTYLEHNYGWRDFSGSDPLGNLGREPTLPGHLPQNHYIRRHISGSLEVVFLSLLYFRFTTDEAFLTEVALPLAREVLTFYDLHYPRRERHLHIHPAQVIEQWWDAENPMPEIAGLHACIDAVISLPPPHPDPHLRDLCLRLAKEVPALPTQRVGEEGEVFAPAESWSPPARNVENPELYAVFPYLRCTPGTENAQIARRTFQQRSYTHDIGWAQDGMQAALLGLTNEARESVTRRLTTPSAYARFPGFWGPGWDWIPDQDQGGSAAHALQLMAMQAHGHSVFVLPAWPQEWKAEISLRAPFGNHVSVIAEPESPPKVEVNGAPDKIKIVAG